jgi:cystathionine gamma-synthase
MSQDFNVKCSPATLAAQALGWEDETTGAVTPAISLSTTFTRQDDYTAREGGTYLRDHGPTQKHAEAVVCKLEGGEQALSFGSGMAACTALFHALEKGDHAAVSSVIYHGVLSWLEHFAEQRGLTYTFFDAGSLESLEAVLVSTKTKLVWLETPSNPTWEVTDLKAACDLAHKHGAQVAVDSTVATPVLTRPIEHGADWVCHAATKYLNGHSDVLGGMMVAADASSPLWERVRLHRVYAGPMLGSMDAYLLIRGMRTLFLRVEKQCQNAMKIARFLHQHQGIERVYYPGLESDPGHSVASRQMKGGFGGMMSVLIPGGRDEAIAVVKKAKIFKKATSLGGVESLIEHRKTSESDVTSTPQNLLRLSIGIEDAEDLISDLNQMLG